MTTLDDKILDYLTGALAPEEVASVEAMIAADPTLEAEVQFHRQILGAGEGFALEEPPLDLSVSLMDAALDEMTRDKRRPKGSRSIWEQIFMTFTQPTLVGSMAVIMVAVVSVGLWRSLEQPEEVLKQPVSTAEMLAETEEGVEEEKAVPSGDDPVALVAEAVTKDLEEEANPPSMRRTSSKKVIQREPNEKTERVGRKRNSRSLASAPQKKRKVPAPPLTNLQLSKNLEVLTQLNSGRSGSLSSAGRLGSSGGTQPLSKPSSSLARVKTSKSDRTVSRSGTIGATADEEEAPQERVLYAGRADLPVGYYERRPAFWAARAKARSTERPGGELDTSPWEKELVRLIQSHGSKEAVKRARAYLKESPKLMEQAHFIYLYAEVLFGSGEVGLAKELAMSIRGQAPYGHVIEMLLEAIGKAGE